MNDGIHGTDGFHLVDGGFAYVPMPEPKNRPGKYPVTTLALYASFTVGSENELRAARFAAKQAKVKVSSRREDDGYRVWRIG